MVIILLEVYRFQQQSERIALLAERLQDLAKKAAMPSAFVRRLKYRRLSPDSYAELREVQRVVTRLERHYKQRTPSRRLIWVSSDEVLGTLEERLAKLESVVGTQERGAASGS
jgi:uncharacterized coiled-coil protein SlyX